MPSALATPPPISLPGSEPWPEPVDPGFVPGLASVIVPVHNRASMIGETIRSVLAQDHSPIEVIVVDDGSTDGTPEAAEAFGPRPRQGATLAVYRQARQQVAAARNAGVIRSRGEMILFIDSDDLMAAGSLSAMAGTLKRADAEVAVSPWRQFRGDGEGRIFGPTQGTQPIEDPPLYFLTLGSWRPTHGYLIRRATMIAYGPEDVVLGTAQDSDHWLRMALGGARFALAEGAMADYRINDDGLFASETPRTMLRDHYRMLRKSKAILEGSGAFDNRLRRAWATYLWRLAVPAIREDRAAYREALAEALDAWPGIMPQRRDYLWLVRRLGHERADWIMQALRDAKRKLAGPRLWR